MFTFCPDDEDSEEIVSDEEEAEEVFNYEVALCAILCHCNTMRRFS